jgi:hypothetical protein
MKSTSRGKSKGKIKSFIYLDEYKMYSISSQIFEGLTEYVINHSKNSKQDLESQEGPVGSGRVLADIISRESSVEERKFLHDYSYNLFEKKLFEDKKVLEIETSNISKVLENLDDYEFIKVKGRLLFSDIKLISETINDFNQLGEALVYITNFSNLEQLKQQYSDVLSHAKNRNDKAFAKQAFKKVDDLSAIAQKIGLNMDQGFLDRLKFVLSYGYKEQFEVKVYLSTDNGENYYLFSAPLKRNHLKEEEHLIVSKFSRYSEKEFVIFGIITQSKGSQADFPIEQGASSEDIKQAISQMVLGILNIEKQFVGKVENEILIDPIAVYREI